MAKRPNPDKSAADRRFQRDSDVVLVHSSDLHLGDEQTTEICGGDDTLLLRRVLEAATTVAADAVMLAGDVFEHNRLPLDILDRVVTLLGNAGREVVILPGNHDPATPDSVYRRGRFSEIPNVSVLGVTHKNAVLIPDLELEIWGHAHRDYDDMVPLRKPRKRSTRWQIGMAHGHYDPVPARTQPLQPAWLIGRDEIAATGVDYMALGHWNRATRVGQRDAPAYYSGSLDLSETVNLVRLKAAGGVSVRRKKVSLHEGVEE